MSDFRAYSTMPRSYLQTTGQTCAGRAYVSNRVFDAIAAGTVVLSDDVAGLSEMLPFVPTFSSAEQLRELARHWLEANEDTRATWVHEAQAKVREKHTFDVRVDELLRHLGEVVRGGSSLVESLSST